MPNRGRRWVSCQVATVSEIARPVLTERALAQGSGTRRSVCELIAAMRYIGVASARRVS